MTASRETVVAADRRHLWRPYTTFERHHQIDPLVIEQADGAWLVDKDGRRYLDGNASWWTCNLGHRHPRLVQAIQRQADRMLHCSLADITHEQAALLAEELAESAPSGLERVFFSDNGSTSVEVALKMAFQYWRQNGAPSRRRFVALGGAYHGDTVGVMSVSDVQEFRSAYQPLLFETIHVPVETPDETGFGNAVSSIENLLDRKSDEIAAVIVEPLIQGAAGMRIWAPELLRRLREATQNTGVFLIADEVFTGFGRTGTMWACEQARISPDILCTAKGLSGGVLPFAATVTTEAIYQGFSGSDDQALMHGHTFCGNPLGAAVAREVLAIYREQDIIGQVRERATLLADIFARIRTVPQVCRTRSLGLAGAVDLSDTGYRGRLGWKVSAEARRRGAYIRPLGDTVYVCPPLTISQAELERLGEILVAAVETVTTARR